eukprot:gene16945-biopygen8475
MATVLHSDPDPAVDLRHAEDGLAFAHSARLPTLPAEGRGAGSNTSSSPTYIDLQHVELDSPGLPLDSCLERFPNRQRGSDISAMHWCSRADARDTKGAKGSVGAAESPNHGVITRGPPPIHERMKGGFPRCQLAARNPVRKPMLAMGCQETSRSSTQNELLAFASRRPAPRSAWAAWYYAVGLGLSMSPPRGLPPCTTPAA